jgi:putative ABC transport system permease protein
LLSIALQELRFALRGLVRSPWFTLTAVGMMTIGLGLAMFMFGAIQSFILRPPPFPDGESMINVEYADSLTQSENLEVPTGDFLTMRREQTTFARFEAFSEGTVNLSGDGRPERYDGAFITPGTFETLGVAPLLGPGFVDGDEIEGAPQKVVLGHSVWQQRFAGSGDVIGKVVRVNGKEATVAGVMPEHFAFPINNTIWLPLQTRVVELRRRAQVNVKVWGRLQAGSTPEAARAELTALLQRIEAADAGESIADRVVMKPYQDEFIGKATRRIISTMFVSVLLALVIACVNVANLMVARSTRRSREAAIRDAMGAGRLRMIMGGLAESLMICAVAGVVGFVLAQIGSELTMRVVRSSENPPPYWMTDLRIDGMSVLFASAIAVFAALLAGLWPAWRATTVACAQALREGGAGAIGGRIGRGLTTAQIALCVVLLVNAGLTVRSVVERGGMDLPFAADNVISGRLSLFDSSYPDNAELAAFADALRLRLEATPGIKAAGITSSVPFSSAGGRMITIEGRAPADDGRLPRVDVVSADRGYFESLQLGMLRGRSFEAHDDANGRRVALLSAPLAERFWPGEEAIGKRFRLGDGAESPWIEVVGLLPHVAQIGRDIERPALYLPFAQQPSRSFSFIARTTGDPYASAGAIRDVVVALDPDLPVYWLRSLRDWVDLAAFNHRLLAGLFGMFGGFAMLLAAAGLYAVLAYQVSQRTREIGVRRALGAADRGIVHMVIGLGMRQLLIGVGMGLVLALGFAQLLAGLLYGVTTYDPATFFGVATLLGIVALVAALVPTRRALAVAPMVALRYD